MWTLSPKEIKTKRNEEEQRKSQTKSTKKHQKTKERNQKNKRQRIQDLQDLQIHEARAKNIKTSGFSNEMTWPMTSQRLSDKVDGQLQVARKQRKSKTKELQKKATNNSKGAKKKEFRKIKTPPGGGVFGVSAVFRIFEKKTPEVTMMLKSISWDLTHFCPTFGQQKLRVLQGFATPLHRIPAFCPQKNRLRLCWAAGESSFGSLLVSQKNRRKT